MRRSWLRRNRLTTALPQFPIGAREGFSVFRPRKQKSLHFFGEAPERRPWAIKREDRPAAFAGRSKWIFLVSRDTARAYTREYPIPPSAVTRSGASRIRQIGTGNNVRSSRGNNVTRYSLEKLVQRFLLPFPSKPQRLGGFQVAYHRQEFLLLPQVNLIDTHLPQRRLPPSRRPSLQVSQV